MISPLLGQNRGKTEASCNKLILNIYSARWGDRYSPLLVAIIYRNNPSCVCLVAMYGKRAPHGLYDYCISSRCYDVSVAATNKIMAPRTGLYW